MHPEITEGHHRDTSLAILGDNGASQRDIPESVRIIANRYLLIENIGTGLLGDMYVAVDQQLSKAVKFEQRVSVELFSHSYRQSDYENQVAAQLVQITRVAHPNLIRIVDFGIDGNTAFLVTELLQGMSLRDVMSDAPAEKFSEKEVQSVVSGVAKALAFIQENGFTHSNLTADSIFITQDLDIKITDFAAVALGRLTDRSHDSENSKAAPAYRNDEVFRLAAIAYEMLTDESLSRGSNRRSEDTLRRNKHIPRFRRKALLRAMNFGVDAERPSLAEFAREFRVTGDRTKRNAADHRKSRGPSFVKPFAATLLMMAATALIWTNREDLNGAYVDLTSGLRAQDQPAFVSPVAEEPVMSSEAPAESVVESHVVDTALVTVRSVDSDAEIVDPEISDVAETVTEAASDPAALVDAGETNVATSDVAEAISGESITTEIESTPISQPETFDSTSASARYPVRATGQIMSTDADSADSPAISRDQVAFDQDTLTVNESESMATISVSRAGNIDDRSSLVWWTVADTANADLDYAELGVQIESLDSGQEKASIFVPIVSDSVAEQRESFFVHLSNGEAPNQDSKVLQVFIIDDDGAHASLLND